MTRRAPSRSSSSENAIVEQSTSASSQMPYRKQSSFRGGGGAKHTKQSGSSRRHRGHSAPGTLSEKEIQNKIHSSNLQLTLSLQLDLENTQLSKLVQQFVVTFNGDENGERKRPEAKKSAKKAVVTTQVLETRLPLLVCGLENWEELIEFQRVVASLKRPVCISNDINVEDKLKCKTTVQTLSNGKEHNYLLGFTHKTEDLMWTFTNNAILRLRSIGIYARSLLYDRQLVTPLASVYTKNANGVKNVDSSMFRWDGELSLSHITVLRDIQESSMTIQTMYLPSVSSPAVDRMYNSKLFPLVEEMIQALSASNKHQVVILRGIPGSGKSSLGRAIQAISRARNVTCTICSADLYFETPRGYQFVVEKLRHAHESCKRTFANALACDRPQIVVVDNTHTQKWEWEQYENLAQQSDCPVKVLEMTCPDVMTAIQMAKRNSHGVAVEKVVQMFLRWEADAHAISFTPQFEYPLVNKNPISHKAMSAVSYVGLFLDQAERKKLLDVISPIHSNVLAEHVTLYYKPPKQFLRYVQIGGEYTVKLLEVVQNQRGQTIHVALDDRLDLAVGNRIPHITLSMAHNVSAYYSNELLQDKSASRTPIELLTNSKREINVNLRLGVSLVIQNQRSETVTSPFTSSDTCCSRLDTARREKNEPAPDGVLPTITNLFVLYLDMSDLEEVMLQRSEGDQPKRYVESVVHFQEQIEHHAGSSCRTRRILFVQSNTSSQRLSTTEILNYLHQLCLPSPVQRFTFDQVLIVPEVHARESFDEMLKMEAQASDSARDVTRIKQVTLLTGSSSPMGWRLLDGESLHHITLNVIRLDFPHQREPLSEVLGVDTSNLSLLFDHLGISINEHPRHLIIRGIDVVRNACRRIFGVDRCNVSTVQRIDTTITGLESDIVDLCVLLPANLSENTREELKHNLVTAMRDDGVCHVASKGCDGFYFTVCSLTSYSPIFRVELVESSTNGTLDSLSRSSVTMKRLEFIMTQRQNVRKLCDDDTYAILSAWLRSVLRARLLPVANASYLSVFANLMSERLVLLFLQSRASAGSSFDTSERKGLPTSHELMFNIVTLLEYLRDRSSEEWHQEFDYVQRVLRIDAYNPSELERLPTLIRAVFNQVHSLQSRYNVDDVPDLARVMLDLIQPSKVAWRDEYSVNDKSNKFQMMYVEISESIDRFGCHQLCDMLYDAAQRVIVNPETEMFFCAPSRISNRVEIAVESSQLLAKILNELKASRTISYRHSLCEIDCNRLMIRHCHDDARVQL